MKIKWLSIIPHNHSVKMILSHPYTWALAEFSLSLASKKTIKWGENQRNQKTKAQKAHQAVKFSPADKKPEYCGRFEDCFKSECFPENIEFYVWRIRLNSAEGEVKVSSLCTFNATSTISSGMLHSIPNRFWFIAQNYFNWHIIF